jgi:hypothetical protein
MVSAVALMVNSLFLPKLIDWQSLEFSSEARREQFEASPYLRSEKKEQRGAFELLGESEVFLLGE